MNQQQQQAPQKWVKAQPQELPKPTYYPFFLALGLVFLSWGILAGWIISLAGFIITVIALTGWINILRYEAKRNRR
ncbi:hypothetical protein [Pontibacter chitinilyticus]|uniref:hypothetical protein n=1 Tax=Pontibacter chitinilyticus TaxID=2674989 RepID=UPI0032199ED2